MYIVHLYLHGLFRLISLSLPIKKSKNTFNVHITLDTLVFEFFCIGISKYLRATTIKHIMFN